MGEAVDVHSAPSGSRPVFDKSGRSGLSLITEWDHFVIPIADWPKSYLKRAAGVIEEFVKLKEEYGFSLRIDENSPALSLSYHYLWFNPDTDFSMKSECLLSCYFEEVSFERFGFRYEVEGQISLDGTDDDGKSVEMSLMDLDDENSPKSIASVRTIAKKMYHLTLQAMNDPRVKAPFPIDPSHLPNIEGISDRDIFMIGYMNSSGELVEDRVCQVRRSSRSMPADEQLTWIECYSENRRANVRHEIGNLQYILTPTGADIRTSLLGP